MGWGSSEARLGGFERGGSTLCVGPFVRSGLFLGLALGLVACAEATDEPAGEGASLDEVSAPDLELESEAWPVWAAALGAPRCRAQAERVRRAVEAAAQEPRRTPIARRGLAELEVCLDRHRVEPEIERDPVWQIEVELEAAPPLAVALRARTEALVACAHAARGRPEGTVRLEADAADRGRIEALRVVTDDTGEPSLAACAVRALEGAEVPELGALALTLHFRAGTILERPCVLDPRTPRAGVRIESLRAPSSSGPAPNLHAFLYFEGTRLTLVSSEGAAEVDTTRDPRATVRCPVAFGPARPLAVVLLDHREGRDRVIGYGQARGEGELMRVRAGEGEVVLRRLP